jgi:hypothetical protein
MSNKKLSKDELSEIKLIKKQVESELKILKKINVPELQIAHLERILRFYKRLHIIQPPSIPDKITLTMIKTQYKAMCAIRRIRPQRDVL